jgi:mono/diheme cytochrome c family protein
MRWLLALALLMLLGACGEDLSAEASGAEIYEATCARCHGADLEGGVGPALAGPDAPSGDLPRSYFIQTTERGKGRMPSYGGVLSDAQIERVVDFILAEQGR